MGKRKYKPAYTLCSLEDFENCNAKWYEVEKSGRKMWHRSALESLQTRTLMDWLYSGRIQACVEVAEAQKQEPLSPLMRIWADKLFEIVELKE